MNAKWFFWVNRIQFEKKSILNLFWIIEMKSDFFLGKGRFH